MSDIQLPAGQVTFDIPDTIVVVDRKLGALGERGCGISVGGLGKPE
jgi:hypothetical protein